MNLDLGIFTLQSEAGENYHCPGQGCVANCPTGSAVVIKLPETKLVL